MAKSLFKIAIFDPVSEETYAEYLVDSLEAVWDRGAEETQVASDGATLKKKSSTSGHPDYLILSPQKKKFKCGIPEQQAPGSVLQQRDEVIKRSILIIGKVGVGKSTMANQIIGKPLFPVRESIEGVTRKSEKMKHFEEKGDDGVLYSISIIDLTRQYDWQPHDSLATELRQVCEKELHSILFVIQKGRLTNGEKFILEHIIDHCPPNAKKISDLIITNCELEKDDARRKIREDFKTDSYSSKIAKFMQNIYTVGFPNIHRVKDGFRDMYEEDMKKDRNNLRELIKNRKDPIAVDLKLETATYGRTKSDQVACALQ